MANSLLEYLERKIATAFVPKLDYCPDGDFLSIYTKGDECYAQRVDEHLTVYRSTETDELVGCKIEGVRQLIATAHGPIDVRFAELAPNLLQYGEVNCRRQP